MPDDKGSGFQLPPIGQIGFVVKDVRKTVEHFTKIGLGPFKIFPDLDVQGFTYNGKPAPHRLRLAFRYGNPQLELIQTLEGETPNSDFLKKNGEGISHFGYTVDMDEFDRILAELAKAGVKPIFQRIEPDRSIVYLNADKIGGIMIELTGIKKA